MAESHVQTAKDVLTKAQESKRDPYLALLEVRNTPVDGYASPAPIVIAPTAAADVATSANSNVAQRTRSGREVRLPERYRNGAK